MGGNTRTRSIVGRRRLFFLVLTRLDGKLDGSKDGREVIIQFGIELKRTRHRCHGTSREIPV